MSIEYYRYRYHILHFFTTLLIRLSVCKSLYALHCIFLFNVHYHTSQIFALEAAVSLEHTVIIVELGMYIHVYEGCSTAFQKILFFYTEQRYIYIYRAFPDIYIFSFRYYFDSNTVESLY